MNNSFALQQISQTGNLDSNLITRQYKLDLMARFMEIKSINPRLRKNEIAKKLRCSIGTLQRYRNDIILFSRYRIPPDNQKRKQKIADREHDLERPQMSSKELKRPQVASNHPEVKPIKSKNILKGGAIIEINDKNLDEIVQKKLIKGTSNANYL